MLDLSPSTDPSLFAFLSSLVSFSELFLSLFLHVLSSFLYFSSFPLLFVLLLLPYFSLRLFCFTSTSFSSSFLAPPPSRPFPPTSPPTLVPPCFPLPCLHRCFLHLILLFFYQHLFLLLGSSFISTIASFSSYTSFSFSSKPLFPPLLFSTTIIIFLSSFLPSSSFSFPLFLPHPSSLILIFLSPSPTSYSSSFPAVISSKISISSLLPSSSPSPPLLLLPLELSFPNMSQKQY